MKRNLPNIDWRYWLDVFLGDDQQPPSNSDRQPVIGEALLEDSPAFVTAFLEFVASRTGAFPLRSELVEKQEWLSVLKPSPALFEADPDRYQRLKAQTIFKSFTTESGYRRAVDLASGGTLRTFLATPQTIYIDERKRAKHSFIGGSSGSGKSEYIKSLVHSYVMRRPDDALVVIDPHGEMAPQIARIPEVARSGRLVYLDPQLFRGFTPTCNTLHIESDPGTAEIYLNQFLQAISVVLSESSEFSDTMVAVLKPIIKYLLLRDQPSSLDDLMAFVQGNRTLQDDAIAQLPNQTDRAFLRSVFTGGGPNIAATLSSIQTRLQQLLSEDSFRHFLCADTSFDLQALLAQSKIIIFSLKETSGSTRFSPVNAIGRFLFAQILAIVLKKDHPQIDCPPLPPIHLFVDEAHNYTLPTVRTILAEARKYGLHLTLATQTLQNFEDPKIRDAIRKNTFLKWGGFQPNGVNDNASLVGVSPEEISALEKGEFYLSPGDLPRFKIRGRADLIGFRHSIPDEEWCALLEEQKRLYYRDISTLVFSSLLAPDETKREPACQVDPGTVREGNRTAFQTLFD